MLLNIIFPKKKYNNDLATFFSESNSAEKKRFFNSVITTATYKQNKLIKQAKAIEEKESR